MNTRFSLGLSALLALAGDISANAQVPGIISYQGRVTSHGTNFTGSGQFKFALLDGVGGQSLWSNNGSSANGSEPTVGVSVSVAEGLFTVPLGDTTFAGMTVAIPAAVFTNSDVRLRIWFNDGASGFALLSPDQRLASAGYAMRAANVVDGAITGVQLANAAVTTDKLADSSVTPEKIPTNSITGQKIAQNSLSSEDIADTLRLRELQIENAGGLDRVQLTEVSNSGVLYMNHGSIGRFLEASGTTDGGFLRLYDALGGFGLGQTTVELGSSSVGGYTRVFQANDSTGVQINGQNGATAGGIILIYRETGLGLTLQGSTTAGQGSLFTMYNGLGEDTVTVDADSSGRGSTLALGNGTNVTAVFLDGNSTAGGGEISVRGTTGTETIELLANTSAGQGARLLMRNGLAGTTVTLDADGSGRGGEFSLLNGTNVTTAYLAGNSGGAGLLQLRNSSGTTLAELDGLGAGGGGELVLKDEDGTTTVFIEGAEAAGNGAQIALYNGAGTATIVLDADFGGESRITTQVLEITGGSDLSENFDIQSADAEPGMIVRIDPAHPGELAVSDRAYDRTVAGVVSGAGGVKPGLLMGQRNTKADGKHPVALTGRVYCFVDASTGAIESGDLITTSATLGHGMRVTDHARAQGAIVGKAMTGLSSGKGLVLVLVSLQ